MSIASRRPPLLSPIHLALAVGLLTAGAQVARASEPILQPEMQEGLTPDTKESCLVAVSFRSPMLFKLGVVWLATPTGRYATVGANTALHGDGVAFAAVPKGPFRIELIDYHMHTGELWPGGRPKTVLTSFRVGQPQQVPATMSGTCDGGFIDLGVYKLSPGSNFTPASLVPFEDADVHQYALKNLKDSLKGTPWEAEIDRPAKNAPIPADMRMTFSTVAPKERLPKPRIGFKVLLLDPGKQPTKELRYAAPVGDKRAANLTITLGAAKLPFTLSTVVVPGTAPDAPLRYEYTVGDDVTGWVHLNSMGQHNDNDHAFKPGKAPKVGPPVSPASQIANTIVPFPDEPVGVGGRWFAELTVDRPNMHYEQRNTYTITSIEGNIVRLSIQQVAQTTFPKPIPVPLKGKPAQLVANRITGKGEARVDLTHLVALDYRLANTAENLFATPGSEPQPSPDMPAMSGELKLESR